MTAQPIGSLYAQLGLDSAQFDKGVARARGSLKNLGDFSISRGVGRGFRELEDGLGSVVGRAGGAGAALASMGVLGTGAALALGGLAIAAVKARDAMNFADEISDTAAKLAVGTDALQEYRYVLHALGGEAGDADAALEGFAKAFGAAHAGLSKKAAKPFQALGLDPKSFNSTEDALDAVIAKISQLGSTAEQAAIADKLGLGPMLVALRAGPGAITDLRKEAERLGVVMDSELVKRAGDANDEFETLSKVVDVQLKSAFVDLAPVLTGLLGLAAGLAKEVAKMTDDMRSAEERTGDGVRQEISRLQNYRTKNLPLFPQTAAQQHAATKIDGRISELYATLQRRDAPVVPLGKDALTDVSGADKDRVKAANAVRDASARAVEQASAAELSARMALTKNIDRLAAMRLQQIDAETAAQKRDIEADASEGKITQKAAEAAILLTNKTDKAKRELVEMDRTAQLAAAERKYRQDIAGTYDRIAGISAELATNAAARNKFEAAALAARQKVEAETLAGELAQQVKDGDIDDAKAQQKKIALDALQAAERAQQAREAAARIEEETNQKAEAGLELQIDVLSSQANASKTVAGRAAKAREILLLEQRLERLKLEEIVNSSTATDAEKAIAQARLGQLDAIQASELKTFDQNNLLSASFDEAANAVGDMANAFADQDWVGMLRGLDQAVASLQEAFGPNGTLGGKVAAVAGLIDGIGKAIGGTTGSTLSGAASGAMSGFMLGGPIGAGIGAIVGGIGGFLSGNSAKKQAKAQAAAERAAQQNDLEVALLEAQGKSVEALAKRREAELLKIDASNRALQEQVWAAQDAADAEAKAAEIEKSRHELDLQMMEASGKAAEALAIRRQDELDGMDESLRPLQQLLWARLDENDAMEETAKRVAAVVEAATGLSNNRLDLTERLMTASNDNVELKRLQRERELAQTIDETSRVILRAIYAYEDLAAAESAVSDARDALQKAYEAELAPLQAVLDRHAETVQGVVDAEDKLRTAYQATATEFESTASKMRDMAAGFAATRQKLAAEDQASRNPGAAYASASANLAQVEEAIRNGDVNGMAGLNDAVDAFVSASKTSSASGGAYRSDVARARAALIAGEKYASAQADAADAQLEALKAQVGQLIDIEDAVDDVGAAMRGLYTARDAEHFAGLQAAAAQQQMDALNAQVSGLLTVNTSVLSVAAAVANLKAAVDSQTAALNAVAQAAAQAHQATQATESADQLRAGIQGALGTAPSGDATFFGYTKEQLGFNPATGQYDTPAAALATNDLYYARLALDESKKALGADAVPGFALGGLHRGGLRIVGERGPELEATGPARYWNSAETSRMLDGGSQTAALHYALVAIAKNTSSVDRRFIRLEREGLFVRGVDPNAPVKTQAA